MHLHKDGYGCHWTCGCIHEILCAIFTFTHSPAPSESHSPAAAARSSAPRPRHAQKAEEEDGEYEEGEDEDPEWTDSEEDEKEEYEEKRSEGSRRFDLPDTAASNWVQMALQEYHEAVEVERKQRQLTQHDPAVIPDDQRPLRPMSSNDVVALQEKLDNDIRTWAAKVVCRCLLSNILVPLTQRLSPSPQ
jgi:hypothetical protein